MLAVWLPGDRAHEAGRTLPPVIVTEGPITGRLLRPGEVWGVLCSVLRVGSVCTALPWEGHVTYDSRLPQVFMKEPLDFGSIPSNRLQTTAVFFRYSSSL